MEFYAMCLPTGQCTVGSKDVRVPNGIGVFGPIRDRVWAKETAYSKHDIMNGHSGGVFEGGQLSLEEVVSFTKESLRELQPGASIPHKELTEFLSLLTA